tara:strand:- start:730 stop:879 length:150 start_codon:yes stop_codon:yes gene_type:complete
MKKCDYCNEERPRKRGEETTLMLCENCHEHEGDIAEELRTLEAEFKKYG